MTTQATVYIVDDNEAVLDGLSLLFESADLKAKAFGSCAEFLSSTPSSQEIACLILDVRMPKMTGPELQAELLHRKIDLPIIFLSGHGNIPLAVKTVQLGAIDFLTKPVDSQQLLDKVQKALTLSANRHKENAIYRT